MDHSLLDQRLNHLPSSVWQKIAQIDELKGQWVGGVKLGPMARCVEDLAYILPVISGPDSGDPFIAPVPLHDLDKVDLSQLRGGFYTDNRISSPTPEVVETVAHVAEVLTDRGMVIEEVIPPGIDESFEIFDDLILAWVFPWAKLILQQVGTPLSGITTEGLLEAREPTTEERTRSIDQCDQSCKRMLSFMVDYDVLISPVTAYAAYPHKAYGDDDPCFSYTNTYSLTGLPIAVVRGGTSSEGLPIEVQIAAKPWREDLAFAVAAYLEGASGGWKPPPI